ncbi:hypothetical protein CROQUDRAFT_95050 [Cronartium quercuum f. sp. fusiforme G11]|uniref:Uncharacterized protein n=1 Tax=Cronartium quercuum f. sp. fusiforme G11 TaxID=708437 RepID=A0A9P6T9S2_9BASI|nr:hypothetical protein CROQUDRAFT_95050 [Cronartium quercuum f. sp. fusiforme G11]
MALNSPNPFSPETESNRVQRFINLFPECVGNPSMSDAIQKLHLLVESMLPLPRGGGGTKSNLMQQQTSES